MVLRDAHSCLRQTLLHIFVISVRCHGNNWHCFCVPPRSSSPYPSSRCQTVHDRHHHIHQNHIKGSRGSLTNRSTACCCPSRYDHYLRAQIYSNISAISTFNSLSSTRSSRHPRCSADSTISSLSCCCCSLRPLCCQSEAGR